ncbi:MAG: Ig-like domain-containing protein [Saprospiraceae bacterium]|nr:Ig-like domain-containing protein [Saprospiraceae bacterium]MCF8249762.1 Ig-like domain-containing protein [Saprospiraceae bacterium]MCF8279247.1 Ig-like domain-containing protein [Bacteroidales bacterium]MCF8312795.1 Ig-like domain-containing protein [Saprospiraceae bacterium]MCF8441242.1 Ig-like domain-containing protein [Saprospiraceae bacterium]
MKKKNNYFPLSAMLLLLVFFSACKKDSDETPPPQSNIASAIFYEPPTSNLEKPSALCKVEMAGTGETVTFSGKFNTDGTIKNITSVFHKKDSGSPTFSAFFTDDGNEMMAFNISEDNVKDSILFRLVEIEQGDSSFYQLYFYVYDWDNDTGELIYTLGFRGSEILFRGGDLEEQTDKFIDWLQKGRGHWVIDKVHVISEAIDEAIKTAPIAAKKTWDDLAGLFNDGGPLDIFRNEDEFNENNTQQATQEETNTMNNQIEEDYGFGSNNNSPPHLGQPAQYIVRKASPINLVGEPNAPVDTELEVLVTDAAGNPLPGKRIAFIRPYGYENAKFGSFEPQVPMTDSDGIARTTWTLGDLEGLQMASYICLDFEPMLVRYEGQRIFNAEAIIGNPLVGSWIQIEHSQTNCLDPDENETIANSSGYLCGWGGDPAECSEEIFVFSTTTGEQRSTSYYNGVAEPVDIETFSYSVTGSTINFFGFDEPGGIEYQFSISNNILTLFDSAGDCQVTSKLARQ